MFKVIAFAVFVGLAAAVAAPREATARQYIVQPSGWSLQARDEEGVVMVSPPGEAGDAIYYVVNAFEPVDKKQQAAWFAKLTPIIASGFGTMTWRLEAVAHEGTLLKDALTIKTEDGDFYHGLTFGYPVRNGIQTMFVLWPDPLTADDPRAQAALDHVASLWRAGFANTPDPAPVQQPSTPAPAPVAPAPSPAPVANGGEQNVEAVVIGSAVIGTSTVIAPYLLLKDGRAFLQVAESPRDFDPASRAPGSYGTGRWQKVSGGYDITYPNASPDQLYDAGRFLPAPPGFRLDGTYLVRGASSGTSWGEQFVFHPDGTVNFAQGSSTRITGADATGRGTSQGRYEIEGWTIAITDAGGRTERRMFARHPADPPVSVVIGTENYRRQ
jgi:hypothetical protein